jgi:ribonuclease HI
VHEIVIYTDGACSGNGREDAAGGWAAVLVHRSKERELSGAEPDATNQRMELRAAIEGLKALTAPCRVTLYSDSSYVVNCFRDRWYDAWRRSGWRNKKKQPVANRELWEELLDLVEARGHVVEFKKVAGHADRLGRALDDHESYNQRCDALAVAAITRGRSASGHALA